MERDPRASSTSRPSSRPTTPLRRLSASSLRSLSLSHSRSRPPTSTEAPLDHLGHIFAELADAMSDLAGNLEQLDGVNKGLDGFNEAFAGYLYGLRMNTYTADFDEAPTKLNFDLSAALHPPPSFFPPASPTFSHASLSSDDNHTAGNKTTADVESSFMSFVDTAKPAVRGGGTGRGRGRGGKVVLTKRKKDEMMAFADGIIQLLPIKFREQQPQRSETETIITTLRSQPAGLSIPDFVKQTSLPTHRLNDALTALVRAKVALKVLAKGVTTYKLDPTKYPPV